MEDILALAFMVFALAFFAWVMHYVNRDEDVRYQRRLNESREFGYQNQLNRPINKPRK